MASKNIIVMLILSILIVMSSGCVPSNRESDLATREASVSTREAQASVSRIRQKLLGKWQFLKGGTSENEDFYLRFEFLDDGSYTARVTNFSSKKVSGLETGKYQLSDTNHLRLETANSVIEFEVSFEAGNLKLTRSSQFVLYNNCGVACGIIGKWRFVGVGAMNSGGTAIPTTSPILAQVNAMLSDVRIEYQFNGDESASFQANGTLKVPSRSGSGVESEPVTINGTGTYHVSADGLSVSMTVSDSILGLLGVRPPPTTEFSLTIQGTSLTLRYSGKPFPSSDYVDFKFEEVE